MVLTLNNSIFVGMPRQADKTGAARKEHWLLWIGIDQKLSRLRKLLARTAMETECGLGELESPALAIAFCEPSFARATRVSDIAPLRKST